MKLNIRSACLLIAFTTAILLLLNPYFTNLGSNLMLAGAVGLIIYLIGILVYYATGQLALMCEAQPAVERIVVYDNIVPIGADREVLNYIEAIDAFQFIYRHPATNLLSIGLITDTDRDEIEINTDTKPGISITETRYTWANPLWQFFAQCPKVAAWAIFINQDMAEVEEEIMEEVEE